ncbi:MAG: YfhO family protein [Chloroflexota bacterium]|nr:YfhO family protein [Chloroflexota bacterium]
MLVTHVWELALIALVAVVAVRLGVFDWFTDFPLVGDNGASSRLPNTFASIDHPFHISKERAVLEAVRDGQFPRWLSNHQAGYPAEFYPLGADLVVVVAWAFGLGLIPLEVVHKLVVITVLFIPVGAYWAVARRDGWPVSVAVVAALLHLFLPGSWLGGGPDELLRMGMWPNVFATYLTLPLMLWSADYLRHGSHRGLLLAVSVATLAIYSNPRATIAVATVLLAVGVMSLVEFRAPRPGAIRRPSMRGSASVRRQLADLNIMVIAHLMRRSAILVLAVGLLSAALILPLRARQVLYDFSHFVEFERAGQVWTVYTGAVPVEVIALAAIGAFIAFRQCGFHTRVLALWLPLALLVIVVAGWVLRDQPLLAQLEGPRLIPLLRLPTLFLAALGIHEMLRFVLHGVRGTETIQFANVAAVGLVAIFVLTPVSTFSSGERGLPALETTNQPAFSAIARSAEVVDSAASVGNRPLIIGSPISEHASFWIPALTDGSAFHAAWVWYWRTPDYADRTRVADVIASLETDFLRRHGLTMVLIAANSVEALDVARTKPYLELIDSGDDGGYAVFNVIDAGASTRGLLSITGGEVQTLEQSRESLRADVYAPQPTEVLVAINDYPAWRATVNGRDTPIRRSDDGYMLIDIPAGDSEVELTYVVESVVWGGRALVGLGGLLLVGVVVIPRVLRRLSSVERRSA